MARWTRIPKFINRWIQKFMLFVLISMISIRKFTLSLSIFCSEWFLFRCMHDPALPRHGIDRNKYSLPTQSRQSSYTGCPKTVVPTNPMILTLYSHVKNTIKWEPIWTNHHLSGTSREAAGESGGIGNPLTGRARGWQWLIQARFQTFHSCDFWHGIFEEIVYTTSNHYQFQTLRVWPINKQELCETLDFLWLNNFSRCV